MYRIYLNVIADCSGSPQIPQTLYFDNDCGLHFEINGLTYQSTQEVSPLCDMQMPNSSCNGGTLPGFRLYRYYTTLYLSPCNKWTISWGLCCRITTVNLADPNPGMYVEATLDNADGICDDSPTFAESGVPFGCIGSLISFNFGFTDPDAHMMRFSLIGARTLLDPGQDPPLAGWLPSRPGFSAVQPIPGITIDPFTGQLIFTPNVAGYYILVVKVTTYDASGKLIGTVIRDQVFVINTCDHAAPASPLPPSSTYGIFIGANSVGVCHGQYFCADLVFSDSNPATVMTVTSNVTTLLPGATFTVVGTNPAVARICWTANAANLPNNIFVEATDNACPIDNVTSRSIFVGNCILLPVELLHFKAEPSGTKVVTTWSTATEQGNDYFTVERSVDNRTFEAVGNVEGIGDTQYTSYYQFEDKVPLKGTSYYRLRQTDIDGSTSYSEVVPVQFGEDGPAVTADWDGGDGWIVRGVAAGAEWTMVDMLGSVVAQGSFVTEGVTHVQVSGLSNAFHMLVVRTPKEQHVLKLPPSGTQTTVTAVSKGI